MNVIMVCIYIYRCIHNHIYSIMNVIMNLLEYEYYNGPGIFGPGQPVLWEYARSYIEYRCIREHMHSYMRLLIEDRCIGTVYS